MNRKIALIAVAALLVAGIFAYSANTSRYTAHQENTTAEVTVPVDGYEVDETAVEGTAVENLTEESVNDTTTTDSVVLPVPSETDAIGATDTTGTTDTPVATDVTPSDETTAEATQEPTADSILDTTAVEQSTYPLYQHTYGQADAPVTIIEYASMSCGHCGKFHQDLFADVKAKVLDTGKAKLTFVDYPLNAPAFKATKLTQCIGAQDPSRYEGILQTLFNNQAQWTSAPDVDAALLQYGRLAGLSEDQFKACQSDIDMENALLKQIQDAQAKYQINSTPSFVLLYNGKVQKISGTQTAEAFEKAIEEIKK